MGKTNRETKVFKEDEETRSTSDISIATDRCKHVFTQDFSVATVLVVAYLIETIVQIVLIVNCYRSPFFISATSSQNWLWILFLSWIVTSLLVTLVSVVWTWNGLDFSGRVCGQLLCYLMHLFLLGFLWRYLKIALAYEKADVEEFFKLRKLQIYIQAFPLLVVHLAYLLNDDLAQSYDNSVGSWMIAGELCSSILSLSLHPLLKLKSEPLDEGARRSSDHKHKPRRRRLTSATIEIYVTIRILLLISRVLVVSLLLFSLTTSRSYWPMLVIAAHLLTIFMWTCLTTLVFNAQTTPSSTSTAKSGDTESNNEWMRNQNVQIKEEKQPNSNCGIRCVLIPSSQSASLWEKSKSVVKNSLVSSYALFWDVNSGDEDGVGFSGSRMLVSLSLPVFLVLVENVIVLVFHCVGPGQTAVYFFVIISGSCLAFGLLLYILMTTRNKWNIVCNSQKELPAIEHQQINPAVVAGSFHKFLPNSVIIEHEKYRLDHNFRDYENERINVLLNVRNVNNKLASPPILRVDEGVMSNLSTSDITNTCNYVRINETLMMAVKMHQGGNPDMNNENKMGHQRFHEILTTPVDRGEIVSPPSHDNTKRSLSSTSSRNTNTISNLTLQNFPDEAKHKNSTKKSTTHSINQSSPLIIRKACKIQLNAPKKHLLNSLQRNNSNPAVEPSGGRNRCHCKTIDKCGPYRTSDSSIYEKLIEDAYGILICEGSQKSERPVNNNVHSTSAAPPFSKKLRVLCAKCLGNHDPLLSNCPAVVDHTIQFGNRTETCLRLKNNDNKAQKTSLSPVPLPFDSPKMYSETTEYPTDTEFTCNLNDNEEYDDDDEGSISTHIQSVTYVNLPYHTTTGGGGFFNSTFNSTASNMFPSAEARKEFTGMEYVKAWLLMNDVEAKEMLRKRNNNNRTNNLSRGNCNKISSKSKHISKPRPNSTLANPYRKSQPICVYQMKSPPMQKQHPDLNDNFSISHHHCLNQSSEQSVNFNTNLNCKEYHNAPFVVTDFNELQNDLLETVV